MGLRDFNSEDQDEQVDKSKHNKYKSTHTIYLNSEQLRGILKPGSYTVYPDDKNIGYEIELVIEDAEDMLEVSEVLREMANELEEEHNIIVEKSEEE